VYVESLIFSPQRLIWHRMLCSHSAEAHGRKPSQTGLSRGSDGCSAL
jgi:hypothetical protein